MAKKDNETLKLLLYAGGGAIVFFTIKKGFTGFLELIGIKNSANANKVSNEVDDTSSPWQPTYWTKVKDANLFTVAYTHMLCRQIYNSVNWYSDDWSTAFGAIKTCKTKTQISWLVYHFNMLYKQDLLTWLLGTTWPKDRFSSDEVAQAINYVKGLPIKLKK
jgi:hypothetical protein